MPLSFKNLLALAEAIRKEPKADNPGGYDLKDLIPKIAALKNRSLFFAILLRDCHPLAALNAYVDRYKGPLPGFSNNQARASQAPRIYEANFLSHAQNVHTELHNSAREAIKIFLFAEYIPSASIQPITIKILSKASIPNGEIEIPDGDKRTKKIKIRGWQVKDYLTGRLEYGIERIESYPLIKKAMTYLVENDPTYGILWDIFRSLQYNNSCMEGIKDRLLDQVSAMRDSLLVESKEQKRRNCPINYAHSMRDALSQYTNDKGPRVANIFLQNIVLAVALERAAFDEVLMSKKTLRKCQFQVGSVSDVDDVFAEKPVSINVYLEEAENENTFINLLLQAMCSKIDYEAREKQFLKVMETALTCSRKEASASVSLHADVLRAQKIFMEISEIKFENPINNSSASEADLKNAWIAQAEKLKTELKKCKDAWIQQARQKEAKGIAGIFKNEDELDEDNLEGIFQKYPYLRDALGRHFPKISITPKETTFSRIEWLIAKEPPDHSHSLAEEDVSSECSDLWDASVQSEVVEVGADDSVGPSMTDTEQTYLASVMDPTLPPVKPFLSLEEFIKGYINPDALDEEAVYQFLLNCGWSEDAIALALNASSSQSNKFNPMADAKTTLKETLRAHPEALEFDINETKKKIAEIKREQTSEALNYIEKWFNHHKEILATCNPKPILEVWHLDDTLFLESLLSKADLYPFIEHFSLKILKALCAYIYSDTLFVTEHAAFLVKLKDYVKAAVIEKKFTEILELLQCGLTLSVQELFDVCIAQSKGGTVSFQEIMETRVGSWLDTKCTVALNIFLNQNYDRCGVRHFSFPLLMRLSEYIDSQDSNVRYMSFLYALKKRRFEEAANVGNVDEVQRLLEETHLKLFFYDYCDLCRTLSADNRATDSLNHIVAYQLARADLSSLNATAKLLYQAIDADSTPFVKALLENIHIQNNVQPNSENLTFQHECLQYILDKDNPEIFHLFWEAGFFRKELLFGQLNKNLLYYAISKKDKDRLAIHLIKENRAQLYLNCDDNRNALRLAISCEKTSVVAVLLERPDVQTLLREQPKLKKLAMKHKAMNVLWQLMENGVPFTIDELIMLRENGTSRDLLLKGCKSLPPPSSLIATLHFTIQDANEKAFEDCMGAIRNQTAEVQKKIFKTRNRQGYTPLESAFKHNNYPAFCALLKHWGVDVTATHPTLKGNILHFAVAHADRDSATPWIRAILEERSLPAFQYSKMLSQQDCQNKTPLDKVLASQNGPLLTYFLQQPAVIALLRKDAKRYKAFAIKKRMWDVLRQMMHNKIPFTIDELTKLRRRRAPVDVLAKGFACLPSLISELIAKVHFAIQWNRADLFAECMASLSPCADAVKKKIFKARNRGGYTPLESAFQYNYVAFCALLKHPSVDVTATHPTLKGNILHFAFTQKKPSSLRWIKAILEEPTLSARQKNKMLSQKDCRNKTPLENALDTKNLPVLNYLLDQEDVKAFLRKHAAQYKKLLMANKAWDVLLKVMKMGVPFKIDELITLRKNHAPNEVLLEGYKSLPSPESLVATLHLTIHQGLTAEFTQCMIDIGKQPFDVQQKIFKARNRGGYTPLESALHHNDVAFLELLKHQAVDAMAIHPTLKKNILHFAFSLKKPSSLSLVRAILEESKLVNEKTRMLSQKDFSKKTPLDGALEDENIPVLKYFLQQDVTLTSAELLKLKAIISGLNMAQGLELLESLRLNQSEYAISYVLLVAIRCQQTDFIKGLLASDPIKKILKDHSSDYQGLAIECSAWDVLEFLLDEGAPCDADEFLRACQKYPPVAILNKGLPHLPLMAQLGVILDYEFKLEPKDLFDHIDRFVGSLIALSSPERKKVFEQKDSEGRDFLDKLIQNDRLRWKLIPAEVLAAHPQMFANPWDQLLLTILNQGFVPNGDQLKALREEINNLKSNSLPLLQALRRNLSPAQFKAFVHKSYDDNDLDPCVSPKGSLVTHMMKLCSSPGQDAAGANAILEDLFNYPESIDFFKDEEPHWRAILAQALGYKNYALATLIVEKARKHFEPHSPEFKKFINQREDSLFETSTLTPLLMASYRKPTNYNFLEKLLELGADPLLLDCRKDSFLHVLIREHHPSVEDIGRLLNRLTVEQRKKLLATKNKADMTPLMLAPVGSALAELLRSAPVSHKPLSPIYRPLCAEALRVLVMQDKRVMDSYRLEGEKPGPAIRSC